MIRKVCLCFICVLFAFFCKAQQGGFDPESLNPSPVSNEVKITGDIYYPDAFSDLNYFLYREWREGILVFGDSSLINNVLLRYDAFHDQVLILNRNTNLPCIADKKTILGFKLIDQGKGMQIFRQIGVPDEKGNGKFYRTLSEGSYSLLASHKVTETKTSLYKDVFGIMRDTEYRMYVGYYLYHPDKGLLKIMPGKRSFLMLSPENKKAVRTLFKKNNLHTFDEFEMIKALSLLESEGFLK